MSDWAERVRAPGLAPFGNAALGERYNRALFRAKARALAGALRSEPLPPPARRRCLDAGVGHGWVLEAWRRQGIREIHGLDAVPGVASRAARAVPGARVRVADLAAWRPGRDERYDLVCALDVLFYLTEDAAFEAALEALAAAVAPGGILAVSDSFVARPHDFEGGRNRPWRAYASVLATSGLSFRRRRAFFALANAPHPAAAGGSPWREALWRGIFAGVWNLARARSPLAGPLEAAAVAGLFGLDGLILSQGGRWGSQEVAVWRRGA